MKRMPRRIRSDPDDHRERGQAQIGPGEDHDARDDVEDRDEDVAVPPLGRRDGGHEAHNAGDDEPHADDERKDDQRVERLLDEHQAGDRAEHADQSEQAAALPRPKIEPKIASTPSTSRKMPAITVNVLSVSCGETTKKMPTPSVRPRTARAATTGW